MVSASLHSLQLLPPSAMSASEKLAPKRLKIKLSKLSSESEFVPADVERSNQVFASVMDEVRFKTVGNNCSDGATGVPHPHDLKARFPLSSGSVLTSTPSKEKRITFKNKLPKNTGDHLAYGETEVSERCNVQIPVTPANKRGPPANKRGPVMRLDNQKPKRQKIESKALQQCAGLLKQLMTQTFSWIFNQPVDPVALQIPDYFSVISHPMDLGTIKSKLEKKLYSSTAEFAADVRLTFSNAMKYNPPSNDVHILAKQLNDIFESRWKTLDSKLSATQLESGRQPNSNDRPSKALDSGDDGNRRQASCSKTSNKVFITSAQRQKLRNDLVEISRRKIPTALLGQLRKIGLIGQHDDRIEFDIDALNEIKVCELQKVLRSYHHIRSAESAHTQYSCGRDSLQKDPLKGNGSSSRLALGSVSDKSRTSSTCINGSCESINSRCSHLIDFPSDSDRSSGRDNNSACHVAVYNPDLPVNDTASKQTIKSDLDSDGVVSAADEENVDPRSHPPTPGAVVVAPEEGWESNIYDGQLSPSKALRAAMLRSRFADTIVKAQQKTLLNNGERSDPVKMKQEKERLEKQQREEKARIEAKIRAAEAASRRRDEMELKKQRERAREAARIAMQKVQRTVQINENMEILKDLEILSGYSQADYFLLHKNNPLERLGLFMKDDYLEYEEELENCNGDVEHENCIGDVEHENCIGDVEHGDIEHESCTGDIEHESCTGDVEEGEIAS